MLAVSDMMRGSLAQYALTLFAALVSALFFGAAGAASAMIGGLAYALPTSVLIAVLVMRKRRGNPGAYTVLVGEFVRILAFGAVIGIAAGVYEDLHWPAVLIGIVAAVSSYFVILFKKY